MEKDIAIKVENVSKTFVIPHEKISSLKGAFVSALKEKRYEEFHALEDVSFEVKKGEFFGIIGRNGSGKSTLLKILAGIYQPDKGKIKIDGRISPFLELGIGFNPELSGRDNIYLNATVLGLTHKQIDEKFDDIVEFSELRRFIDQKVKNYSSGMQVRLAFSVAIHANRDILLMDEVLAVGDSNFQGKCLEEFNKYRDQGKTVIIVSHDIATVQRYCNRSMLLRNGRIEMIGGSEEVGNKYIYQNMSDEEKRVTEEETQIKLRENKQKDGQGISQKEKIRLEEKRKNRVVEITRVEYLDEEGNRKNVFETGDNMSIRIYFDVFKMKEEFNFGIAIYNQENDYVLGINTIFDNFSTRKNIKDGYFQVDYRKIPLIENSYYVRASIVKDNFNLPYALMMKSKIFRVISKSKNQGIVNMDYEWK